jgi:GrpB-like predicted nucleotidyltransferase (UPF0157 family)
MSPEDDIPLVADPLYTNRFASRDDDVREAVEDGLVDTFHVGSTAVADLNGQPLLDLVVVFEDATALTRGVDALAEAGYEPAHEGDGEAVLTRWEDDHGVLLKLHIRGDQKVANQLIVREYLRDHASARREYERTKSTAWAENGDDQEGYTGAKTAFVTELLDRAREAGYESRVPATA